MGKTLAIKGHSTRGKEVIELLEMMGGINPFTINDGAVIGNKETSCYYISKDIAAKYISWDYIGPEEIDKYKIFTLEEFLEKYPFKVGDKVLGCYGNTLTVKSMEWSEDFETMVYDFEETEDVLCAEDIEVVNDNTTPTKETITPAPDITANITDKNNCDIECPDGYEFYDENGNLIGNKVLMRPKKPKYPKTYEECRAILNYNIGSMSGYKASLLASLQDLLVCRDAYWKIAGEQMGLDGPWEPDWTSGYPVYCISVSVNRIGKGKWYTDNKILAFPTEEMRDAFYENFKDLIEGCKKLL